MKLTMRDRLLIVLVLSLLMLVQVTSWFRAAYPAPDPCLYQRWRKVEVKTYSYEVVTIYYPCDEVAR